MGRRKPERKVRPLGNCPWGPLKLKAKVERCLLPAQGPREKGALKMFSGRLGRNTSLLPMAGGWPSWRGRNIPESALPPPGLAPSALEESDFPGNQGLSCRHCLPRNSSDLFVSPGSRSEPSFGREWEPWAPALQPGRHSSPAPS